MSLLNKDNLINEIRNEILTEIIKDELYLEELEYREDLGRVDYFKELDYKIKRHGQFLLRLAHLLNGDAPKKSVPELLETLFSTIYELDEIIKNDDFRNWFIDVKKELITKFINEYREVDGRT